MKNIIGGLIILVVVGVGVGFAAHYFSQVDMNEAQPAAGVQNPEDVIIVAKVGEHKVTRQDFDAALQNVPAQLRGQGVGAQLYPIILEQLINTELVNMQAKDEINSNDPRLQEQMREAEKEIRRQLYLEDIVANELSEEKLMSAYEQYVAQLPEATEIRARHILVEDEQTAKDLIEQAKAGADFAQLAMDNSTGPSAEQGGDLGYFTQDQMVAPFAEAAFALEMGEITDEPVQTQFGWHVIKVEDRRAQANPKFSDVRSMLEQSLRKQALQSHIASLREGVEVERFTIDGDPMTQPAVQSGGDVVTQEPVADEATETDTDAEVDTDTDAGAESDVETEATETETVE